MAKRTLISIIGLLLTPIPLLPWGPDGHKQVAGIAFSQLNSRAKTEIAKLLEPGETIESIASWADEIRPKRPESGPWHYINIPIDATQGSYAPYCPTQGCVIRRIEELTAFLRSSSGTRTERAEALKFLVHFVGDMHQPLHCGDNRDRGGNDVQVVLDGVPARLHSIWDEALVSRFLSGQPGFTANPLKGIGWWKRRGMRRGSVESWAWQAHDLSRDFGYANLGPVRPVVINETYASAAMPVIEMQIQRGGLRLGKILNEIWK